jgi:multicomponent Na+:H+ antiporter subunit D
VNDHLLPLAVAIPLLGAAVILAASEFAPRRAIELLGIAGAGSVGAVCLILLGRVGSHPNLYWFGDWTPRRGIAVGISFVAEPIGVGLAALTALLMTASFIYSWRYFDAIGGLYHSLMLVFLAGMVGLCLSGDLFNMFVFFELMGIPAFALTAYKIEEEAPLLGSLNFAVTNGIGGAMILVGIALTYGRTGALNLAQIGESLGRGDVDALVVAAFTMIAAGMLIKTAQVPLHFWLADAHAFAPTPVCVLFSGVMVEIGLYTLARIYWTAFSETIVPSGGLRAVLVGMGLLTALVGAVMCAAQRHLKRMLAFSTVSHSGVFLAGFGLLEPAGLSAVAVYVLSHGLVKGALFLCVGAVLHRKGTVAESDLFGRCRDLPVTGILFTLGGLALAGAPPFGTFVGKYLLEEEAIHLGWVVVAVVMVVSSALTGGAVLRAAGGIFLGLGPRFRDPHLDPIELEGREREPETVGGRNRTPGVMIAPTVALIAGAVALGAAGRLPAAVEAAAEHFQDQRGYARLVLQGEITPLPAPPPNPHPTAASFLLAGASVLAAAGLALGSLWRKSLPRWATELLRRGEPPLRALRRLHSGHLGDYVAWLTFGVAAFGGILAVAVRGP